VPLDQLSTCGGERKKVRICQVQNTEHLIERGQVTVQVEGRAVLG
jgi:hypothetical protein